MCFNRIENAVTLSPKNIMIAIAPLIQIPVKKNDYVKFNEGTIAKRNSIYL